MSIDGNATLLDETGTAYLSINPLGLLIKMATWICSSHAVKHFFFKIMVTNRSLCVKLDSPPLHSTHIIDIDEDGAVDVIGIK